MRACPSCGTENPAEARFCLACGTALAAPPRGEVRKVVTVLFADVRGSTALGERLDPEALRRVMAQYFEAARTAIERHGGTVEKFIGDAVMAVFGIPVVHEDDALRALRAAFDIRDALERISGDLSRDYGAELEVRTGINTGEVVAGEGETLVTGDAVNVAARLEQAAQPGEILIGAPTRRLVAHAAELEPVEPIHAKGKAELLEAFRVVSVSGELPAVARRLDAPIVGRDDDLERLVAAFAAAKAERRCRLATVVGDPGIGKSRLGRELIARVGDEASVLVGRCLPYGDGITYWPLREILVRAGEREADARLMEFLAGEPDADLIATRIAAAVGASSGGAASDEIFWAVRKLFERLARERPLVVVFDDVHWAEPTFLDLVEHVAYLSTGAPMLLLCLARPEFLEARPGWPGERLRLEPLGDAEVGQLMRELGGANGASSRVAELAAGNPLFVEQMLAMLDETHDAADALPPTIQALLAARLDRLTRDERRVLAAASVVGSEFWSGAVRELAEGARVVPALLELVRKDMVRPAESTLPGEDAFRFVHILVRDAAYAALPLELRAELHERFADWLESHAPEMDEIVGYHLEQAWKVRSQLAPQADAALAARAAAALARAGRRASGRGDLPAAATLLRRATNLMPASTEKAKLLCEIGAARFHTGDPAVAEEALTEAHELARALGNRALELRADLVRARVRLQHDPALDFGKFREDAEAAVAELERLGDEEALTDAWSNVTHVHLTACQYEQLRAAADRWLQLARRTGNRAAEGEALFWAAAGGLFGPMPASEGIAYCERLLESAESPVMRAAAVHALGAFVGMAGDVDQALALNREARTIFGDLGLRIPAAGIGLGAAMTAVHAGRFDVAEADLRTACDTLEELGETGFFSTNAAVLAKVLWLRGRYGEAERYADASREATAAGDVASESGWRAAKALVLAGRGEHEEAVSLAREAVALLAATDAIDLHAGALDDLGRVLALVGRRDDALGALREALALHERKENLLAARGTCALIAELAAEPVAERD